MLRPTGTKTPGPARPGRSGYSAHSALMGSRVLSDEAIRSDPVHVMGNRTYAIEHGPGFIVMDPGFDCSEMNPLEAAVTSGSTVSNIVELVGETGRPVTHLLLSHGHEDHSGNLNAMVGLRMDIDGFDFTMVAHEASHVPAVLRSSGIPCVSVTFDTTLDLPGGPVEILVTPGHTLAGADICAFFPGKRLLFVGDMAQPQGPSYEKCDFKACFSNHKLGEEAMVSLDRLSAISFDRLLMGHDGVILNREKGLAALEVTRQVLERTRELALKLTAENPGRPAEVYMEWIYDTISWERGMARDASEIRKSMGHDGFTTRMARESYYSLYDTHAIRYFVEKLLGRSLPGS